MVDLKVICCVCLNQSNALICINDADDINMKYFEKLNLCLPDLGWSEAFKLCLDCAGKVDNSFDFLQMCIKSEQIRKTHFESEDGCKEEIKLKAEDTNDGSEGGENFGNNLFNPNVFICDICSREFTLKKSLRLHITKKHSRKVEDSKNDEIEDEPTKDKMIQDYPNPKEEKELIFSDFTDHEDFDNKSDDSFDLNFEPEKEKRTRKTRSISRDKSIKKERKPRTKIKLPVKCEYCGKDFNRKQHLLAHIRCIHTFEKPYHCDICDAKFSLSHSLLVHKRRHNDDRRYVCTYCGKKFLCSTDLVHHNKIHLNKREYKCEPCNKSFNTISVLQIHRKCVHTDPELWKHVCSYCNRRFPIKSSLTAHLRRHTGEKNFACNICGKAFYDKKMVENHYRSHTDERLFKCHLCEKDYKDRGGLNLHLKKVHDVGNATIPPPPPKKFACHLCPKAFSSRSKLQKHICTHTGEKMFNCHLCDKKFNDSWYKKVHMQKKHNITGGEEDKPNGMHYSPQPPTSVQQPHMSHMAQPMPQQMQMLSPIKQESPQLHHRLTQPLSQQQSQQSQTLPQQNIPIATGHPSPYNQMSH